MSPSENGGIADLLVLSRRVCSPTSPDPRDRQVFRRAVLTSRLLGGGVRALCLESQPGADPGALEDCGVPCEVATGAVDEHLRATAGRARALWVTDVASGRALLDACGDAVAPFVLDLESLPSLETETTGHRPGGRNSDGLGHLIDAQRAVERRVIAAAAAVAVSGRQLAAAVEALVPGCEPMVISPPTSPTPETRRSHQRSGVLHYGRWVSEPGHPDEDGLMALLEEIAGSDLSVDQILAQDAPPRFRAIASGREVLDPAEWPAALRCARVVVLPRRSGVAVPAVVAELTRQQVPFLADAVALLGLPLADAVDDPYGPLVSDPRHWPERLAELYQDPGPRHGPSSAAKFAAEWLDDERVATETARLLEQLGLTVTDGDARHPHDAELARRAPASPPAGTTRVALDLRDFERRLLGPAVMDRPVALQAQARLNSDEAYRLWKAAHIDGETRQRQLRERAEDFTYRPTISVIMPTYRSDPVHLLEAIGSVTGQTWPHWQLCIADDGSDDPSTTAALDRAAEADSRIQVRICEENAGIAAATNAALEMATGDYIAFLDHDDVLAPTAMHWIVELLNEHPELDIVYTDEDHLDLDDELVIPTFKPDWSPDLLAGVNYISHFTAVRHRLIDEVGGLRTGYDGSQDFDLMLRLTERTDRIGHVAAPLYSWRQTERSTALDVNLKPEADDAGARALADALERRGADAEVRPGCIPTWHEVRYRISGDPLVSVLIPTRDGVELLRRCVASVRATCRDHRTQMVVIDNQSSDPATLAYFDQLSSEPDVSVISYPERFNYARQINLGAAAADGEILVLLNNDTIPLTADWLEVLLGHAQRPEVGCVGPRLRFPTGDPQHEGIAVGVGDTYAWNVRARGHPLLADNIRNTAAVTGACLVTRRAVFESVGGLDEQLRVAFNDVDFCLRVGEAGYRIIYSPWAELEHDESASRGALHPEDDEAFYLRRWGPGELTRDPFYPPAMDMADPVARFRI